MYSYVQIGTYVFLHKHNVDIYNTQKYIATCIHKKKTCKQKPIETKAFTYTHLFTAVCKQTVSYIHMYVYICRNIHTYKYKNVNTFTNIQVYKHIHT